MDANSSLDSRVRAGDKPKSLKTESTIELEVVWREPPDGRLAQAFDLPKPVSGSRYLSRSHVVLTRNAGSADLRVDATRVGKDLLVTLVGGKAHVGAVALGGFHRRSFASVLTVPNHRDDIIAKEAALRISKELRQSCVVVVGIHVHDASEGQVAEIVDASFSLVDELIEVLK